MASITASLSAKCVVSVRASSQNRRPSVSKTAARPKNVFPVPTVYLEKSLAAVQGAMLGLAVVNAPLVVTPQPAEALTEKMEAIRAKDSKFYVEKESNAIKEKNFFSSLKAKENEDKAALEQVKSERAAAAKAAADARKSSKKTISASEKKAALIAKAEASKSNLSSFESDVESKAKALKAVDAATRAEKKQVFKAELAADKLSAAERVAALKTENEAARAALEAAKSKNAEALRSSLNEKKSADYKRDLAGIEEQKIEFAKRAAERKAINDAIIAAGKAKVNGGGQ